MDIEQELDQWSEGVKDRVDNLCAIYKCADIKTVINIVMMADSVGMSLFRAFVDRADEDDSELVGMLGELTKDCLTGIAVQSVELLCVAEDRKIQLIKDIIGVVKTRYALEEKINSAMEDDEDE